MPLTDRALRHAKPKDKPYKLADEKGLFLLVNPGGSRYWRMKYRFAGKEKSLALGVYPDVSLKEAREGRTEAKRLLANDVDPSNARKLQRAAAVERGENSYERVAREWFAKHEPNWAPSHSEKVRARLEKDLFPWVGARPIAEIEAPELLAALRRIESRGAVETAHRALQDCGRIFRYAIATGRATRNPAADLRGALAPPKQAHFATMTDPKAIGELLRAMDGYQGSLVTSCALQLAPLVFVRPGELRHAEWAEFQLEAAEWRIPGEKMKMGAPHLVPLSTQVLEILEEVRQLTGHGKYVFPCARSFHRPMSENTVNAALRRLGYTKEELTAHGFRSMASTLLNEAGWHRDAIERQLAHAERDNVRAAYNYAEHLPERREMMQAWADYLDGLKAGGVVIPFRRVAG